MEITRIVAVNLSASLCGLHKIRYSQEHFGELTDVNGRHVIICDPQKVASSRMPHTRCSRLGKKHVASGEVSDVIQVLPQEIGAGQSDRNRGRACSRGTPQPTLANRSHSPARLRMRRVRCLENHVFPGKIRRAKSIG
jgi:hypothetical protein